MKDCNICGTFGTQEGFSEWHSCPEHLKCKMLPDFMWTRILYKKMRTVFEISNKPQNKAETYALKLRNPKWRKFRNKILERDNFTCQHCQNKGRSLHAHHLYYDEGIDPWDYPMEALITLCSFCHKRG